MPPMAMAFVPRSRASMSMAWSRPAGTFLQMSASGAAASLTAILPMAEL